MRMSLTRFAGLGIALMAGVTLASCASSSAFFPATGPNTQINGFPGGSARVHFIMGSPQVNVGVNNTDLYIDNVLAFTNFFYAGCAGPAAPNPCLVVPLAPIVPATSGAVIGPATPYIALPIGRHDFKLVQHGTLAPAYIDLVFTLAANTKYAFVASGDAGYSTTGWRVFTEPVYQTPAGNRAASVFDASPESFGVNFIYGCGSPNGPCLATGSFGTSFGPNIGAGGKIQSVLLKASPTGTYCFGVYNGAGAGVTELPFLNAAAGPPFATMPIASANDPNSGTACTTTVTIAPSTDNNFYIIDAPSVPPNVTPAGPATVDWIPDSNG